MLQKYGELHFSIDDSFVGISAAVMKIAMTEATWAVVGYADKQGFVSTSKRNQLLAMADYISGNKLPVILENNGPMTVKPRVDAEGRLICVSFVNASIGDTEPLNVIIRKPASEKFIYRNERTASRVTCIKISDDEYKLTLPAFKRGWDIATLFSCDFC